MKLIDREQVAGMNIHYMRYSLEYFLEAQERAGFKTIELWGGIPHVFMDSVDYCKKNKGTWFGGQGIYSGKLHVSVSVCSC